MTLVTRYCHQCKRDTAQEKKEIPGEVFHVCTMCENLVSSRKSWQTRK